MIHGRMRLNDTAHSVNVPIYQTSTFQQQTLGGNPEWEYARTGNPTRTALEDLIADLEGGKQGFAFASGMAAVTAVLSLFRAGDRIIISGNVYGGTFRLLDKVFENFGITYSIEDTADPEVLEEKITPDVKAIFVESPTNPLLTVNDISAMAALTKRKGILSIADSTFMTPYLQRPLELGADIVIHSATKYLGGHSDLLAGLVVVNSDEIAKRIGFLQNASGAVLGPFDSFLLIRGIKTLAVRMDRHVENAEKLARYLEAHPAVRKVYYPGLPDAQGYEINRRQAKNGGAMISFELEEGYDTKTFFSSLRLITLAESLGGVESLVCHPASMTHAAIPEEIRLNLGVTDRLIRLSVGIEHADDLKADLEQAIQRSRI
ncbi:MAG: PLP-dependent aspartate aminotransferase family protein [Lachnospiraceae bacterium]|nr:PLP-dependent aspartate aminotransferase family protein [Lachnospiraceae bacterium]